MSIRLITSSYYRIFWIILLLLFGLSQWSYAQRTRDSDRDYYLLAWRDRQPETFIDHHILASADSLTSVIVGFNFSYDFLQFKKWQEQYRSALLINIDVYTTSKEEAERLEKERQERLKKMEEDRKRGRRPSSDELVEPGLDKVENLIPVKTLVLRDTVYAASYESTSSTSDQFRGNFMLNLPPGFYRYTIEVRQNGDPAVQRSRFRTLRIQKNSPAPLLLAGSLNSTSNAFDLFNLDQKIPFGQDFSLLALLPDSISKDSVSLQLTEAGFIANDSSRNNSLAEIYSDEVLNLDSLVFSHTSQDSEKLKMKGMQLWLFNIPGKDFPNSRIQAELKTVNKSLLKKTYASYWTNMPLSLFNVDLAIDMLRFIVPENKLKELKTGKREEKIAAFEAFWKQRDPSPDTDFNELMAEYYRRIDYAFKEYSSPAQPGFESDMGKYYILLGPPDSRNRTLLGNGNTRETWSYPKVELIFQSTSGFGDYQLIERKTK